MRGPGGDEQSLLLERAEIGATLLEGDDDLLEGGGSEGWRRRTWEETKERRFDQGTE
jgi:hypothetical protein